MKGEVYHGKRILSLWKFKAGTDSGRIKTHRRRWDESIKAYVAEEFTRYLRKVIDKNTNKEELIRDMGRAFVHFFQDHPQSFLLITNQKDIDIQMSKNGIQKSNYEPFQLFVEQASTVLKEWGVTEEQIPQKILELWALVNGLAGIYVMQGFHYEGDWMEMVNNIITDTGTIKNCIGFLLGQAIGIGGGGMINSIKSIPDGHGPKKNITLALNELGKNIMERKNGKIHVFEPNYPALAYKWQEEYGWRMMAKKNGLKGET